MRFADLLAAMGAAITRGDDWIEVRGGARLRGIDADFNTIPDAAMTAAIVALFADGPTTLRNIGSWRVKETDRIAAMATELRKLGAAVDEGADWLRVSPPRASAPATIDTYDDHRMAMCFSLGRAGWRADTHQRSRNACARPSPTISRYSDAWRRRVERRAWRPPPAFGVVVAAPVIAIDGPAASGKGTVAPGGRAALGLPLSRQRCALPAGGAQGATRLRLRSTTSRGSPAVADGLELAFRRVVGRSGRRRT